MSDVTYPKPGESEGIIGKITGYNLILPPEVVGELQWCVDDEIDICVTEVCCDWGESQGLVLRNLTKELEDVKDEV